jgi:hypothetical protein
MIHHSKIIQSGINPRKFKIGGYEKGTYGNYTSIVIISYARTLTTAIAINGTNAVIQ